MRTRAERRQASKKALNRGRKIAKSWGVKAPVEIEKIARKCRDTPARCSCPVCCNKRSSLYRKPKEKLTLQERRNLVRAKEDVCA